MKKDRKKLNSNSTMNSVIEFIKNNIWVCMLLMAILSLIILFFLQDIGRISGDNVLEKDVSSMLLLVLTSLIGVIATLVEFVNYYKEMTEKRYFKYREYLVRELENDIVKDNQKSHEKIKSKSDEIISLDKKDIMALMLKNHDEINEYFKISKSQAKVAFWLSVIACVFGLAALFFGIYSAILLNNVEVSIISIVSGAVSEVIAATVFWVHNKSALQLNHYYNALHENEKFLSAVNMADKLGEDNREKMIMEIIRNQISVRNIEEK